MLKEQALLLRAFNAVDKWAKKQPTMFTVETPLVRFKFYTIISSRIWPKEGARERGIYSFGKAERVIVQLDPKDCIEAIKVLHAYVMEHKY